MLFLFDYNLNITSLLLDIFVFEDLVWLEKSLEHLHLLLAEFLPAYYESNYNFLWRSLCIQHFFFLPSPAYKIFLKLMELLLRMSITKAHFSAWLPLAWLSPFLLCIHSSVSWCISYCPR